MKAMGLSRKKRARHLDEAAAQIILQSYLDSRTEYKSQTRHAAGKS
jgi:RNase H-fold protein (predicted Holliday junction resolvase)